MVMANSHYHIPVLLHDAVNGLVTESDGVYVDVTFGGGGHSREILSRLKDGQLVAFDQDADAVSNQIDDERFHFVPQNFRYIKNHLRVLRLFPVDGVLADLGVSSHQFDVPDRGFSFRFDGPLDMRMDQGLVLTAAEVLNGYEEADLSTVFWEYGELKESRRIARKIVQDREDHPFKEVKDLIRAIESMVPSRKQSQFLARVFQALRIEVNQEMEVLKEMLQGAVDSLKPGGRLVVISYHSLEDRIVKNFFKKGKFSGEVEKDFYGNPIKPLKEITRKPILPSEEEIDRNSRARSAKMRIAEKIEDTLGEE